VIILGSRNVQVGGGLGTGSAVDPPEAGSREAVQGTKEIFARDKLVLQVDVTSPAVIDLNGGGITESIGGFINLG
jgi:hypothetical protein